MNQNNKIGVRTYNFLIEDNSDLIRVDKFLINNINDISRAKIQKIALNDLILVNNNPVKSNYKLKLNDFVFIKILPEKNNFNIKPQNIPLNIQYEDDDILIINKNAGLVVHPGSGNYDGTLVNGLIYHYKNLPLSSSEFNRPGIVHRIDKNTSGLLVIAKNENSMRSLSKQFSERKVERKYIALVWGDVENDGSIQGNIGRHYKNRKLMNVYTDGDFGKYAKTNYKVLQRFGYVTLLECKLETGRTHQIRAHFSYIKHPLFNDFEYGGNKIIKGTTFSKYKQFINNCFKIIKRQSLHAKTLSFFHPVKKEKISFSSDLPDDMREVILKWKNYTSNRM